MYSLESFIFILFIAGINCIPGVRNNEDKCLKDSFKVKNIVVDNGSDVFKNRITFLSQISIKEGITIPPIFQSKEDYQSQCFDTAIYEIYTANTPKPLIKKELSASGLIVFESLQYTTEYTVETSYKQKSPNEIINQGTFKKTTCYGEPSTVKDLEVSEQTDKSLLVSWKKPLVINAPKVCFYEVVVKDIENSNSL